MAIVGANLIANNSIVPGSSIATASASPASNKLDIFAIASRTSLTVDPNQPTLTGCGLTWVAIDTIVYDNTSSSRRRLTIFRSLGASPSSGALTADFGGQIQTHFNWSLDEFSGINISGTNGSGAVSATNFAHNFDGSETVSTLSVGLSSFASVNNGTYGSFASGGGVTYTPGSGFTQLGQTNSSDLNLDLISEWKSTNDTGVDITGSSTAEIGGIAFEIIAAAITGSTPERSRRGMGA